MNEIKELIKAVKISVENLQKHYKTLSTEPSCTRKGRQNYGNIVRALGRVTTTVIELTGENPVE